MKVKIRKSNINMYYNDLYIENEVRNIIKTLEMFDKLTTDDAIPFNQYIDAIDKIFNIQMTYTDLIKISSVILGNNSKISIFETDLIGDVIKRVEINNTFKYLEEEHKLSVIVAFSDDNNINYNCVFCHEEIVKFVKSKKIILLDYVLNEEDDSYTFDEYQFSELYPLSVIVYNNFINLKIISSDYIEAIYIYLKSYFTKEKIKEYYDEYINDLRLKLNVLENHIKCVKDRYSLSLRNLNDIIGSCNKIKEKRISKDF